MITFLKMCSGEGSRSNFELTAEQDAQPLEAVFGKSLPARERASRYGKKEKPLLRIPKDWDPKWKVELEELWRKGDFLQATSPRF